MIRNTSKRTVVAEKMKSCTTLLTKARGLMFRRPIQNEGYVFVFGREAKWELHMLFVFFVIDVLYVDRAKKVVDIKKNLLPFTFYIPKKAASYIIELRAGELAKSKTEIGDVLQW